MHQLAGKQSLQTVQDIVQGQYPELTVKLIQTDQLESNQANISAFYDPELDEDDLVCITVELIFSNKDTHIVWCPEVVDFFVQKLSATIKHEKLHQSQHRARNFEDAPTGYDNRNMEYEYMSRPDEIEAYAMNIADELVRKSDKETAKTLLRMACKTAVYKDKQGNLFSPDLFAYMSMWNFDSRRPVIKRLLKKTWEYIHEH